MLKFKIKETVEEAAVCYFSAELDMWQVDACRSLFKTQLSKKGVSWDRINTVYGDRFASDARLVAYKTTLCIEAV